MNKELNRTFWENYKIDTTAGAASGLAVAATTHPIDTLVVRAQNSLGEKDVKYHKPFNPSKGKKLKDLYKGIKWKVPKVVAAGAVGYPVFTGTKALLENKLKKQANLAVLPKLLDFGRGAFNVGKMNLKSKPYITGGLSTMGAFTFAPKLQMSKLETVMKQPANLKLPNVKKLN